MPKYKVTAPDGRIIVLTGDSAPTDADIDEVLAGLPPRSQNLPIEPERDVATGMAHSALKGATVGLAPKLFAGSESLREVGPHMFQDYRTIEDAMKGVQEYKDKIQKPYQEALEKEITQQAKFEKDHPVLAFGADMVGSSILPLGAVTKVAKTTKDALKTGAKLGTLLGATRGGLESTGDTLDTAINMIGGAVLGGATGGLGGIAGYGLSKAVAKSADSVVQAIQRRGARKLAEALQEGTTRGQELYLGKLSDPVLKDVNAIREISKVARLDDGHVYVPEAVVRHLKERRLIENNYTPDQVIKAVSSLFNKNSKVFAGKQPHIQAIVDNTGEPVNVSFIGDNKGKSVLKTAYQTTQDRAEKGFTQRGALPTSGFNDNIYPQSPVVNQNLTRDETRVLERAVGGRDKLDEILYNARKKNISLVETGDEGINRALMQAEQASPAARNTISKYQETRNAELPQQINNAMDVLLGKKQGLGSIETMQNEFQKAAQPYYESAFQAKIPDDKLVKLSQNKILTNTSNKVNKDYANTFGGRKEVKIDDLEYWDGVKRKLDNEIAKEINSAAPDGGKIRNLEEARSELVSIMDEISPAYKEARNISSNKFEVEDAYKLSDKVFRADMTPDKFKSAMGKMSKPQVEAMKIGLRDKIANMLGARLDEASSFGKLLPKNAQENIRAIMGKEDGNKLIEFAQRVYNTNKALYSAKGNSLTAIRSTLADEAMGIAGDLSKINSVGKAVTLPLRWLGNTAVRNQNNKTYNNVANALINNARGINLSDSLGRRIGKTTNNATNKILRALTEYSGSVAPIVQSVPVKTTGSVTSPLLKALGY